MAKLLRMTILSRLKLRGRLLAGFLACAALAAVSGGVAVVSLRQIQSGTQATGDQITGLIDQQRSQGRWFRALRRVVCVITNAEDERLLAAGRRQFQELQEPAAGGDQQTAGVLRAIDQLLKQRSEELAAAAALAASSGEADKLLKDLMEAAKRAASSAQVQVDGRMTETGKCNQNRFGESPASPCQGSGSAVRSDRQSDFYDQVSALRAEPRPGVEHPREGRVAC